MISTRKYYFLPFLDHLAAVGIAFLLMMLFGSWFANAAFATVATILMLFTLCGRIYVRMWNLSHKNTLRHYGLKKENFIKFILPLVIVNGVIALFYCLCELNIIPVRDIVVKTYYEFPENAPRVLKSFYAFDYIAFVVKIWFLYFTFILKNGFVMFLSPILSFASAMLGYFMGAKDKQILNYYIKATEKAKKKFNE